MTVKFILIAVIVGAGGALGAAIGEGMKQTLAKTEKLHVGLKHAAAAMMYRGMTLSRALAESGELTEIGEYIENNPAQSPAIKARDVLLKDKSVSPEYAKTAADLIERMSYAAVNEDIRSALEDYERHALPYLEEKRAAVNKRAKLARTLSLMASLTVAIIVA